MNARELGIRLVALAAIAAAATPAHAADGAVVFSQNCLMCHQSGGAGLAGQFPRLAGRAALIGGKPKSRGYLIDLLTYGMTGTITVDGQDIIGLMPPFAQLSDEDVAAVLNYVQSLGEQPKRAPAPFTAEEVRAGRGKPAKTPAEVHAERQSLGLDKQVP
jgi:mono/diheme cytochrome c family protein